MRPDPVFFARKRPGKFQIFRNIGGPQITHTQGPSHG